MKNIRLYKNLLILVGIYLISAAIIDFDAAIQVIFAVIISIFIVKIIQYILSSDISFSSYTPSVQQRYEEFSQSRTENFQSAHFVAPVYDGPVAVDFSKGTAKTDDVIAHDVINQMQTDVNTASAEELATLPGINIVMAKRAVQFRDTKRYFKDKDDFFEISGVKEHFRDKIAQIITVNQPKTKPQTGGGDDERIVDI